MIEAPPPPSVFLPPLRPPPSPETACTFIEQLEAIFTPRTIVVDLRGPELERKDEVKGDTFETEHARGWVERVLALGMRYAGDETTLGYAWEAVVDRAASLLASMSAGAGTTMRSFLLPTLSSSINIRETTLLGHSTGFRTWGSAPLLARLLCTSPDQFFATKSPVPRCILELGSGTGLVGMVVASLLVDQDVSIHLTDFDPIILTNLSHNLSLNPSISPLQVSIMPLDWSTFYTSRLDPQPTRPRYYTIFAADVIFEPSHVPWIHATVSALLHFPSSSSPSPTLHLILPLRRTHSDHTLRFEAAFSPADIGRAEETEERTSVDEEGQRWRLSTQDRMTLRGPDGFGTGKEVRDDAIPVPSHSSARLHQKSKKSPARSTTNWVSLLLRPLHLIQPPSATLSTRSRGKQVPAKDAGPSGSSSLALTSHAGPTTLAVQPNKVTARSVPAFLNKLYTMVNDPTTDDLIRWSDDGDSFFVPSAAKVGRDLLPRFFKHSNFGSFVRQLNMYGFHKVPHMQQGVLKNDSEDANELLEFTNPHFARAQPDLLCLIRRQKTRGESGAGSSETALDLPTLLTDLASIRKHQSALSADLLDLQTSNHALWQEASSSRERHTKQQETIDKILRFLATVFGGQGLSGESGDQRDGATVVEEEPEVGKGKGKAKESTAIPPPLQLRSRLLLEDVKGRKEARDKQRREEEFRMGDDEDDEIEEIPVSFEDELDDMPTISSNYTNSRPGLTRSPSKRNQYSYSGNASVETPSAGDTPHYTLPTPPTLPTMPARAPNTQFGTIPPDVLSSLLSPSNPNTLAALQQLQNTNGGPPAQHLPHPPPSSYPSSLPLDPSLAAYDFGLPLPPAPSSTDYLNNMALESTSAVQQTLASLATPYDHSSLLSAIQDNDAVFRDVTREKADIDQRTAHLETAVKNLMATLPEETRKLLNTSPPSTGLDLGPEMKWDANMGLDAELENLIARYANDDQMPMQEDAPDYSFLLDSQDQSPAAGIFDLVSPMDSGLNSKAGSVGTPSTVSTPVAGEVESGKGKSTKRKSDVHSPEVRKSARRA